MTNPKITAIFDYIIEVSGFYPYKQRQFFTVVNKPNVKMILISATENKAFLLADSTDLNKLKINDELKELDIKSDVGSSLSMFGKIINIEGNAIFPRAETIVQDRTVRSKIFGDAHKLMTVKTLNTQLYTGIIPIDLLIPIGKGQRELIIGDRQTGKTHIAINTIINAAKTGTKCIYVSIGQKKEELSWIYETLKEHQALSNTIIIDSPATSAYQQYLAPYVGMAHAENLSYNHDVLIIFDDLSKHANIFREIALLTDKPVGKEAMPGDMFFAHSSLLERAGSFVNKKTITALPIIKTVDGDITGLIASNVISITDGQIVTSSDLFASGKLPAIDIDFSVSRTGSQVQSRTITKVASEVGKIYKSYKRHLKLAMLDYELNKETSSLLYKGKMVEKMFNQKGFSLYSQSFVLLMSKIIMWGILRHVKEEQKAMEFIDAFIQINDDAKKSFTQILNNEPYDDELVKDFFGFALLEYSKLFNYNWKIEINHEFVPLNKTQLEQIAKKLGDK
ncbi:MSC_0619 family F1-like ATPase alpha subunit [Mycoplasma sp. 1654_15]|uniref:MSC_0619 family F1-like ATPase alpha subunit n=1 Tax=Mycoplasma sp. 1654_15 TaxID=2725994 RepID=UPI001449AC34|nr:ATP F0F1 synthase subunit alpha [Mycoplasma sp. 1654_15]QJB71544.1 ATP F0F1 synthase subunit alpha [Mycoplasma sp. 1654_15]